MKFKVISYHYTKNKLFDYGFLHFLCSYNSMNNSLFVKF